MRIVTDYVIRPMLETDLEAVLAIEQVSFPIPWKRDHFLHEISSPCSYPVVAENSGRVVAYVCLTSLFEEAQILDIAVDPGERGRGLAKRLMVHAMDVARGKGATFISLEVRETNTTAILLYERLEFIRTGRRSKYYEGREDALLMEKSFEGES